MLKYITKNGEVTFDTETQMYQVWDEPYSVTILETEDKDEARGCFYSYSVEL